MPLPQDIRKKEQKREEPKPMKNKTEKKQRNINETKICLVKRAIQLINCRAPIKNQKLTLYLIQKD